MNVIKNVTFFGSSKGHTGQDNFDSVKTVATEVAKTGRTVVNGGGPGIMLAATEGAKQAGGRTTVVYYQPTHATQFEGKTSTNIADEHYEEANYIMRTKRLLELGDAYIVFNGGTGTISEMAMAWGLARLYFGHHKPLLLYGDFWYEIIQTFKENMMIRKEEYEVFTIVTNPDQVLRTLDRYEKILHHNRHNHLSCEGEECSFMLL